MALPLLLIGLVSMLGQVVLLRELSVAFFGSELIYALALGVWLLGSAAGAALGGGRSRLSPEHARPLFFALAAMLPAAIVFTRESRRIFGGVPGAYLTLPQQMAAMAVALLPIAGVLGLLFPRVARAAVDDRRTLARAYAIESAGASIGGVAATLALRGGVPNVTTGLVCAGICLAGAALPLDVRRSRALLAAIGAIGLLLGLALVRSADVDRALTARNHPALAGTRDTPYGRVTVTESAGQVAVFENDALAFESGGTVAEELVHLAAIQHPDPKTVLVLGGGVEGLVREVLRHHPSRVDYVELNRGLFDLLAPRLPEAIRSSLADARVRVTIADPRRFLRGAARYDLILVGMPEPDSGQANRFYTREFFRRCADHLRPGGVLAFRLRGAENLWTPQQTRRAASIHRALRDVFADAVVLPGAANVFVASGVPLLRDPAALASRLVARGVSARLVIPAYVSYLYTNDRFREIADALRRVDVPANTDARPVCYQYTWLLWLSRFFPEAARLRPPDLAPARIAASPIAWASAALLAAGLLLARRRPAARRALLAGVAGFSGMMLETVLLLSYQVRVGVLFQDLGLLLTAFMIGLAVGAGAMDRLASRSSGSPDPARAAGLVLFLLAAAAASVAVATSSRGLGGLGATASSLFATGALTAALFACAARDPRAEARSAIAPLYASDLLGGGVGSLGASLLLVPAAGLGGSAALTAATALAAALLL
jgi:spermidine synthase